MYLGIYYNNDLGSTEKNLQISYYIIIIKVSSLSIMPKLFLGQRQK
jgi:hypothetical protein